MPEKVYIGDGVYASFSGHDIKLTTDEAVGGIYLDNDTLNSLIQVARRWGLLTCKDCTVSSTD